MIASPANMRVEAECPKMIRNIFDKAIGDVDAAAFASRLEPDIIQLSFSPRRQAKTNLPSAFARFQPR